MKHLVYLRPLFIFGLSVCHSLIRANSFNGCYNSLDTMSRDFKRTISDGAVDSISEISDQLKYLHYLKLISIKRLYRDSSNRLPRSCECNPFSQPHLHPEGEKFGKNPSWRVWQYAWLGRKYQRRRYFGVGDYLKRSNE